MSKSLICSGFIVLSAMAFADTETVDGVTWTFSLENGTAVLGSDDSPAVAATTSGAASVPAQLGGATVTSVGEAAFSWCSSLTSIELPSSVTTIGADAFYKCAALEHLIFRGDMPSLVDGAFNKIASNCTVCITRAANWPDVSVPGTWQGLSIAYVSGYDARITVASDPADGATFAPSTNVVLTASSGCTIHYTTDGSEPTVSSAAYDGPLGIAATTTVRYFAIDSSTGDWGPVASTTLTRVPYEDASLTVSSPTADGTTFEDSLSLVLNVPEGCDAYYTLDGTDPHTSETRQKYSDAIALIDSATVRFYAVNTTSGDWGPESSLSCRKRLSYGRYVRTVDGITWKFRVADGEITLGWSTCNVSFIHHLLPSGTDYYRALPVSTTGEIVLPAEIEGLPVTAIGDEAFAGCTGITSVVVSKNVTRIGDSAFKGCAALRRLSLPESLQAIGPAAFSECPGLGSGLVVIDGCALTISGDCDPATTIPAGTRLLAEGLFAGQDELRSLVIPEGVRDIPDAMLYDCCMLTDLTLPSTITNIGCAALGRCTLLKSLTIPASVTSIDASAFGKCDSLTEVTVEEGNPVFASRNGLILSKDGQTLIAVPPGIYIVDIPEGVRNVGEDAFVGRPATLTVPASVTDFSLAYVGRCAVPDLVVEQDIDCFGAIYFEGAPPENLNLEFLVEDLRCQIWYNREYTSGWTDALNSIEDYLVEYCYFYDDEDEARTIKSAPYTVGASPSVEWTYWLEGDYDLEVDDEDYRDVYLGDENAYYDFDENGDKDYTFDATAVPTATCGALDIPATLDGHSVVGIGIGAFNDCCLAKITVPEGVAEIREVAFASNWYLREINLPSSLSTLKEGALACCRSLRSLTIPGGIGSVPLELCNDCILLRELEIQDGVKSIGANAFKMCNSLQTIRIPESVTKIDPTAFSKMLLIELPLPDHVYCSSRLKSLTIPVGFSLSEFFPAACLESLSELILVGDGKTIPDKAYAGCTNLKSVTIPKSVMRLGDGAFQDCNSLEQITFLGDAPDLGTGVFAGTPRQMKIVASDGTLGWDGAASTNFPSVWGDRMLVSSQGTGGGSSSDSGSSATEGAGATIAGQVNATIVVTNVIIHYVLNSVSSASAVPLTADTRFVNIITEVKGTSSGAVAIPDTWADQFPNFRARYGDDMAVALTKPTGKLDAAGNPMFVWQDYVAGTDPTDNDDVFRASITIVDGVPVISYSPELPEASAKLRKYTTYGRAKLTDEKWTEVESGHEGDFNFFKVTVEMR